MKVDLTKYKGYTNKSAVLLQSGGLDSIVCSALLVWAGFNVVNVFIDYGQSALEKEKEMAEKISSKYGHKLEIVKIDIPWFNTLPIVGGEVKSTGVEEIKRNVVDPESYVPLRNHLFLSIAGSLAESREIEYVCTGLNGEQDLFRKPLHGFVDTHKEFTRRVEQSLNEGSVMKHKRKGSFKLLTPLIGMSKPEVILLGEQVGADFEKSWSCFNNGEEPCLHCSSCIGREEGFILANMSDPLLDKLKITVPEGNLFQ